jgi:hypothetical protein
LAGEDDEGRMKENEGSWRRLERGLRSAEAKMKRPNHRGKGGGEGGMTDRL